MSEHKSSDTVGLLRKIFMLLTVLIVLAVLLLIFQFTDVALRVWDRLQHTSTTFLILYTFGVAIIALMGMGLIYRIWTIGRRKANKKLNNQQPLRLEDVQEKYHKALAQGIDVSAIQADLTQAAVQEPPTTLEIALFGKISTGKSSLIQTILPSARIDISIIGGSTTRIERYHYETNNGLGLTLYDMPGTNQAEALPSLDQDVLTATRRVHLVVYVLDQDITASDQQAINRLDAFGKPLIVVLNKIGRYDAEELQLLEQHIAAQLPPNAVFVQADSAHQREITVRRRDGSCNREWHLMGGNIHALLDAFARLGTQRVELAERQRNALLHLADETLGQQVSAWRSERGEAMIKAYARKAMLGGVAAVGPGTDILIQGYLGVDMMKSLTKLYDIPVKDIDLQILMESASGKVKSQLTIILALAGNVCKAFPGIGTVIGGASHAVAYGLIFESLGRATLTALTSSTTAFNTNTVMQHFEEQLHHDLEKRAKSLIHSAIAGKQDHNAS